MPMGGWTEFGPALAAPVGRIYWAGTETSERWPGFYEGAAQSAVNAVNFVKGDVKATGDYKNNSPAPTPAGGSTAPAASPASSAVSMMHSLWMAAVVAMVALFN